MKPGQEDSVPVSRKRKLAAAEANEDHNHEEEEEDDDDYGDNAGDDDTDKDEDGDYQGKGSKRPSKRPLKRAKLFTTSTSKSPSPLPSASQGSATPEEDALEARDWKEGDRCLALYQADNLYYPAVIKKVDPAKGKARVEFSGYDEQAVVLLKDLVSDPDSGSGDAVMKDAAAAAATEDAPVQSKPSFEVAPSGPQEPFVLQKEDPATGKKLVEVNPYISQYLREYQKEGIKFLFGLYSKGIGGLLGDDMGLGKTIQVIGFVSAILGKTGLRQLDESRRQGTGKKPVLIVCPSAVLFNWKREFETWGYFGVEVYHGGKKKDQALENIKRGISEVLVTTFETLRINKVALDTIAWELVVADEAHRLKEPKAKVTEAFKSLRIKKRYGLTGTPIQNAFKELWCLLDWANPDIVGDWSTFDTTMANPILQGQKFNASKVELSVAKQANEKLQGILQRFFLRRTKSLIANQMPKKQDFVVFVNFGKKQEEVYQNLYKMQEFQLINRKDERCDCGRTYKNRGDCCHTTNEDGLSIQKMIFICISQLKKAANHSIMMLPNAEDDDNESGKQKRQVRFADFVFGGKAPSSREAERMTLDFDHSGKLRVVDKLVQVWKRRGDKAILFSHSVRMLDILEKYVSTSGYDYCRLDGSTDPEKRLELVDEFNLTPTKFLFLISTKAGGIGLNLTSANRVVIFDPDFNPSHDLQAQDRVFRIGQQRNVKIYRLITAKSIEDSMYQRQIYKQQVSSIALQGNTERRFFTGVAGDKNKRGELFGVENLLAPFGSQTSTKDIVGRADKAEMEYRIASSSLETLNSQVGTASLSLPAFKGRDSHSTGNSSSTSSSKSLPAGSDDEEIASILSEVGFEYVHSNADLFGGSEAEEMIRESAERAVETRQHLDTSAHSAVMFDGVPQRQWKAAKGPSKIIVGETPREERDRQFMKLAQLHAGRHPTPQAFARFLVSDSNASQRRGLLEDYYQRNPRG